MIRTRLTLNVALCVAAGAAAQAQPSLLWQAPIASNFFRHAPVVAADDTIYLHRDSLYSIAPDGSENWAVPLFGHYPVALGADGVIHVANIDGVYAYNASSQRLWRFVPRTPNGRQVIQSGPTVGPDGNIYCVDEFVMGAYSVTPEGDFRWNTPGFTDDGGEDVSGPHAFSNGNIVIASDTIPVDEELAAGFMGLRMSDGSPAWHHVSGDPHAPIASPNGSIHAQMFFGSGRNIGTLTPDGELDWYAPAQTPVGTISEPVVDENGVLYFFQNGNDLVATNPDGSLRFRTPHDGFFIVSPPALTPNGRAIIAGTGAQFGAPGEISAFDTQTGEKMWTIPLPPAPEAGRILWTGGAVAFSN
ncbi:MAG: outer membrane protein assembly factor BamB family protein, partial [Phycisphaerales bacterium]